MKSSTLRFLAVAAATLTLSAPSAQARDLGLNLDDLLKNLTNSAAAAGSPLKTKKVGCRENKKPGDATKTIISCSHLLGTGKILITNADPSGPLIDVNTQRWDAGDNGPAANMVSWLAAALTKTEPASHMATSNKAVKQAQANKTSATDIDGFSFVMMDFGNSMVISVSRH